MSDRYLDPDGNLEEEAKEKFEFLVALHIALAIIIMLVIAYSNVEPRVVDETETGTYESFDWPGW